MHMKNTFEAFACENTFKVYASKIHLKLVHMRNTFGAYGHGKYIWSMCAYKIHLEQMLVKNTFGACAREKQVKS